METWFHQHIIAQNHHPPSWHRNHKEGRTHFRTSFMLTVTGNKVHGYLEMPCWGEPSRSLHEIVGCTRIPMYQYPFMGKPFKKALYNGGYLWVIIYNPQESLENTINTMGTLLGVHPIVPWSLLFENPSFTSESLAGCSRPRHDSCVFSSLQGCTGDNGHRHLLVLRWSEWIPGVSEQFGAGYQDTLQSIPGKLGFLGWFLQGGPRHQL